MQLTQEQINKFKEIHTKYGGLDDYTEEQIVEVANGVANYYLRLFNISQRIKKVDAPKVS